MRRPTPILLLAILAAAALAACNWGENLDEYPCPQGGTKLTWENFGKGFFAAYCNHCHSAEEGDRNGAPGNFVFDTAEQVRAHKERIFVRAADSNDSMPPGPDDPPIAERTELAEWLACGAP